MIVADYLNLITSEHRQQPLYLQTVALDVTVQVQVQDLLSQMIPLFDLDLAVGSQLDILGKWIGASRNVAIPIAGIFFSWDDMVTDGWDYGTWIPTPAPTLLTSLPDDAYKNLLRARIAANNWDGTIESAYAIWAAIFPKYQLLFQDNQNMTYDLGITGGIVDALTLALITMGYLPLRPEGVRIVKYYVATDSNKAFGWDVGSALLGGWDEASWLREVYPP